MNRSPFELLDLIAVEVNRRGLPVAHDYKDWLICMYACASFGEKGRECAHLLSATSPKYKPSECDRIFNACLKNYKEQPENLTPLLAKLRDVGFYLRDFLRGGISGDVPSHGTSTRKGVPSHGTSRDPLNWDLLPSIVREYLELCQNEPLAIREAALLGYLAGWGAMFEDAYFVYDARRQGVHTYYCCTAPAASGKSILTLVKDTFRGIHKLKRDRGEKMLREYEAKRLATKAEDRNELTPPPLLSFFLPADTSNAALLRTVKDNNGCGLIWESELDTLTRTFKSDFGNFSDALRSNFHSENISYNRKQGRELLEIANPRWGVVVSGTPGQVGAFFKSSENGLLSRFVFSILPTSLTWANKWDLPDTTEKIKLLSANNASIYTETQGFPVEITFSKTIQERHFAYFAQAQSDYYSIYGASAVAVVRRIAVTVLRWSACLTLMGAISEQRKFTAQMACPTNYFTFALQLAERAMSSTIEIIAWMPEEHKGKEGEREAVLTSLPSSFTLQDMPNTMHQATKYRWLSAWIKEERIIKQEGGTYQKR